jgi:ApaG protein
MPRHDFAIDVATFYVPEQSDAAVGRFVFGYTITIRNVGTEPATLRSRHWVITNGNGERQDVRGPGVVGEQPHLAPGQQFEYTSGAVLATEIGSMYGSYQFEGAAGERFCVPIPAFTLSVPNVRH